MKITFNQKGTFEALHAAKAWCKENGISVGQSCAMGPSGLLFGEYGWIAKWKNLTQAERLELDGDMDGDFREGPVIVTLKDSSIEKHAPHLKKCGNTE